MSVIDKIERGELVLAVGTWEGSEMRTSALKSSELLRLAKLGATRKWIDGTPPAFGPDERQWVVIEYLTFCLKTKAYLTVYWNGASYSDKKVQFARKWMPLPDVPAESLTSNKPSKKEVAYGFITLSWLKRIQILNKLNLLDEEEKDCRHIDILGEIMAKVEERNCMDAFWQEIQLAQHNMPGGAENG